MRCIIRAVWPAPLPSALTHGSAHPLRPPPNPCAADLGLRSLSSLVSSVTRLGLPLPFKWLDRAIFEAGVYMASSASGAVGSTTTGAAADVAADGTDLVVLLMVLTQHRQRPDK